MTDPAFQFTAPCIEQTRWRCRSLSMPTMLIDAEGQLAGADAIDALGCDGLEAGLRTTASDSTRSRLSQQWGQQDQPRAAEWGPGVMAIPIVLTERRRRMGYVCALVRSTDADDATIASSFGVDHRQADVAAFLASIPVADQRSVRPIETLLNWVQSDTTEIESKNGALESFSGKLTESYEEISLLYRLGEFMTELAAPERFVEQTCEALHSTLSFKWVGAAFVSDHQLGRHMAGARVIHGADATNRQNVRDVIELALDRAGESNSKTLSSADAQAERGVTLSNDAAIGYVQRGERVIGVIVAGEKQGPDCEISSADLKLIDAAAGLMGIFLENACLYDDQQAMFLGMLEALTAAIDAKDRYTCGHSERVAYLAVQLAREIGMNEETSERLRIAGLVHDIGKIGVPESVLTKPGRLTDDEFELIKNHPEIGVRILRDIPQLADVLPGVLHHHERWDGKGYPYGLAGEHIPLFARLLALADSFDAMSSTRTYRSAMPRTTVLDEIRKGSGTQFDPSFAEIFIELDFSAYDQMVEEHLRRDPATGQRGSAAA